MTLASIGLVPWGFSRSIHTFRFLIFDAARIAVKGCAAVNTIAVLQMHVADETK